MAHQCCLQCKVEASPANIEDLFRTVAHPTLTLCLGECCTWDSFKNILEGPHCWPLNGVKHLFLGLRIETWNGLDLITLSHVLGTWIIRVSAFSELGGKGMQTSPGGRKSGDVCTGGFNS